MSNNIVLLLTHSKDFFTIDRVAEAVAKKGAIPFRFDTDQFPQEIKLTAKFTPKISHQLIYNNQSINSEQVRSVWTRRIWQPQFTTNIDPKFKDACIRESQATLTGFWDSLRSARWLDNLDHIAKANNKLFQLRLASEIGLIIPPTVITNDPEVARNFFQEVQGKMVSKLLTAISRSMEKPEFFLYTSKVTEKDLKEAESLRYCPMVFQAEIPKQLELRIIFVNGQVFVGALDCSIYNNATVDWRKPGVNIGVWQNHNLPEFLIKQLQTFMNHLGLHFGAFDFILTPEGEYIFLEINPQGEWGMLERDLELPISQAIADFLVF
jgi:MvdC family ATP-grasp ribosomal peptide maturase